MSFLPETLPRISAIGLDWRVVAFGLGLAVLTGIACGLIPAFAAARTGVNEALKEGGRTGTAGTGHATFRSALMVVELAVALLLLTASGLLLRSFEEMRSVGLGFQADHTLTAADSLPRQQYSTQAAIDGFNLSVRTRLEQLRGVRAVGMTSLPWLTIVGEIGGVRHSRRESEASLTLHCSCSLRKDPYDPEAISVENPNSGHKRRSMMLRN